MTGIIGTRNWKDESIRYNQETAIIERFLADLKITKQATFWLESCNVSAACCGIESVGGEWKVKLPSINGKNILSQKDIMFDFLYSNAGGRYKRDGICENEVPENIAFAINRLSTAIAKVVNVKNGQYGIESMIYSLASGNACEVSYLTDYGGGHYICVVAYDYDAKEFIYYNSWLSDKMNKNRGIKERFPEAQLAEKMRPRYIEIARPA